MRSSYMLLVLLATGCDTRTMSECRGRYTGFFGTSGPIIERRGAACGPPSGLCSALEDASLPVVGEPLADF